MKKALTIVSVTTLAALWMGASAEACTASTVIDIAKASKVSDTESIAKDVAREELDKAGYGADKDVVQTIGILAGTINDYRFAELTATPLEAATGTLILEGNADWRPYSERPQTPSEWRALLDKMSMEHEMSMGVRAHMLHHASEFGLNPPVSVLRSTATGNKFASERETTDAVETNAPASEEPDATPVAPPIPPHTDHAG